MKTSKLSFLFLLFCCFVSIKTVAQYGNGYGNGYGNNRGGSGSINQLPPDKPKETPAEEIADKAMVEYTKELQLDALQEIAIRNLLLERIKTQTALIKSETISQADKAQEIEILAERNDQKIKELLNPEQLAKYKTMQEEMSKPSKKKKQKKAKPSADGLPTLE